MIFLWVISAEPKEMKTYPYITPGVQERYYYKETSWNMPGHAFPKRDTDQGRAHRSHYDSQGPSGL
jgi:hypothetical protein